MERYYKKYSKFLVFPAVFLFICVVAIPFAIYCILLHPGEVPILQTAL